ncbi:hypothetical protein RND81_02G070400 [Saponaria officinalis]|uniref:3-hydroxyisobutyryl-CoA hydrolase n=1 Tax=Saponaria officinalis TaxID=3572 RepID=A0AAW1MUL2_SAPOF
MTISSMTIITFLTNNKVLVEGRANSRAAILNRPSSLNAINISMVARLKRLYESWEENSDLGFLIMKGSGRAFCSGTDVVNLYQLINDGKVEECKNFIDSLYRFVYLMGTYVKLHVAILDGITMGAGGGISLPGMFKLVTDRTVFSHPETQLGFHPDAGASYYLSRLPGYLVLGLSWKRHMCCGSVGLGFGMLRRRITTAVGVDNTFRRKFDREEFLELAREREEKRKAL